MIQIISNQEIQSYDLLNLFLYLKGELADAIKSKTDIRFGVYHSLFEWFNPLFLSDEESLFTKRDFVLVSDLLHN